MAESSFPGSSDPFGGGGGGATRSGTTGMAQVREEDEMDDVTSPDAPSFSGSRGGPPPAASSATGATSSPFAANFSGFGSSFTPSGGVGTDAGSGGGSGGAESLPANYGLGRRTSVSAESMNPNDSATDNWTPPFHQKSAEQTERIKAAVAANFLFSHLDDEQAKLVLDALMEKTIPVKGIKVIVQGDAGDYFYVVERGQFDVHIHPSGSIQPQPGTEGIGEKVASIGPGGSFGELALMYNAPRAATVISTEGDSHLWALDRVTFRRILMDAAFQRRRMYESFLEEVPLLSSLTSYERAKIADALETQKFQDGESIIREGDPGENFYLLESGTAVVFKKETGDDRVIHTYNKGDYFGELALLDDKPRAATIVAKGPVKVATLGKEGFQRLLGPVEDRMRENDPSKKQAMKLQQEEQQQQKLRMQQAQQAQAAGAGPAEFGEPAHLAVSSTDGVDPLST